MNSSVGSDSAYDIPDDDLNTTKRTTTAPPRDFGGATSSSPSVVPPVELGPVENDSTLVPSILPSKQVLVSEAPSPSNSRFPTASSILPSTLNNESQTSQTPTIASPHALVEAVADQSVAPDGATTTSTPNPTSRPTFALATTSPGNDPDDSRGRPLLLRLKRPRQQPLCPVPLSLLKSPVHQCLKLRLRFP